MQRSFLWVRMRRSGGLIFSARSRRRVMRGEAGAPVFGFVAVEAFDGFGDGFSVPVLGQEVVAWVPGGWECVC